MVSVLARNCKPSGTKMAIALGGPVNTIAENSVWLGSIANWSGLHYEYHNCYSN